MTCANLTCNVTETWLQNLAYPGRDTTCLFLLECAAPNYLVTVKSKFIFPYARLVSNLLVTVIILALSYVCKLHVFILQVCINRLWAGTKSVTIQEQSKARASWCSKGGR